MADEAHSFREGDRVRGKESELVGIVRKVLDAGYLMIRESEFDMDLNVHASELVKDELNPLQFKGIPKQKNEIERKNNPKAARIDLHWEKLPSQVKQGYSSPIEAQVAYCEEHLAKCIYQGSIALTIIHGKGSGALHKRIIALLRSYSQIKSIEFLKVALESPHGIVVHFR